MTRGSRQGGFSLLEVALVIVLLGIMAGGMLGSLQARLANHHYREAERELARAEQALLGYAAANGARLPCPDINGDGAPDREENNVAWCREDEGDLPWALLGVPRFDPWGSTLRYRPDRAFLLAAGLENPPDMRDGIRVTDRADGASLTLAAPHGPAAIIFSCGRNGLADGENASNNPSGTPSGSGDPGNPADPTYEYGRPGEHFDDVLIWVSKNVALARLISAGAWPG